MKNILQKLFNHHILSRDEAQDLLIDISQNQYPNEQLSAFVTVFLMRGISLPEMQGFRDALQALAVKLVLDGADDAVDIVGTGGDGKDSFNISTLSCFVVAGAGQRVIKHGNYGVSTVSGSSNVLENLGYKFKDNAADLNADLAKGNLCFLHAPLFHPALKSVAGMRKSLGLRTFFNLLGPLVNPAQPKFAMIGVYHLQVARLYQYILEQENTQFLLVHGLDGYDEVSLTQESKLMGRERTKIVSPQDLGFRKVSPESIFGGETPEAAAKIFVDILSQNSSYEQRAVVLANAALALELTGKYASYSDALLAATDSLDNGKALQILSDLTS